APTARWCSPAPDPACPALAPDPRAPDMDQAAPCAGAAECGCPETRKPAMRTAPPLPVPAAARVTPGPPGSGLEDGSAPLAAIRRAIDLVDGAWLLLLAARGRLATQAGRCKRAQGRPILDAARERRVHERAQRMAAWMGLPGDTAAAAVAVAIADARRRQARMADLDQG